MIGIEITLGSIMAGGFGLAGFGIRKLNRTLDHIDSTLTVDLAAIRAQNTAITKSLEQLNRLTSHSFYNGDTASVNAE